MHDRGRRRWLVAACVIAIAAAMVTVMGLRHRAAQAAVLRADPDRILADADLRATAIAAGRPVFEHHCAVCHGSAGRADPQRGIPDLTDDEHLYGSGKVSEIEQIARYGIRAHDKRGWTLASMPAYASAVPYAAEPLPPSPPPDITFAHVINPMPAGHGLHADVEVTFAALARAAAYARARGVGVRLLTCEFAGEARIRRPAAFEPVANLTRHAFEAYELGRRGVAERRLPFVTEIFENAYRETEGARFLGYTNADIAVQEDFYVKAAAYAKASDAFVINRVEVDDKDANGRPYGPADLETLYALGRKRPQRHAGYDCFFWRRDRTPLVSLFVRNVFVGYPPVGRHVMEALRCVFGTKYREIRGAHHTFHLGDRNGGWSQHGQYEHMNRRAARLAPGPFRRVARCGAGGADAVAAAAAELRRAPFERWDVPGVEWPPREV